MVRNHVNSKGGRLVKSVVASTHGKDIYVIDVDMMVRRSLSAVIEDIKGKEKVSVFVKVKMIGGDKVIHQEGGGR